MDLKVLSFFDAVVDREDREIIGTGLVIAVTVVLALVVIAAGLGLAVRVFELASG